MLKTKPAGSMKRESDSEDQMWGSLQEFFSENPKGFFKILSSINEEPDSQMFKAINLVRDEIVAIKEINLKREDDKQISELTSFDPSAQTLQCEIRVIDKFLCKKDDTSAIIWLELEYCQMGSLKEIAQITKLAFSQGEIAFILEQILSYLSILQSKMLLRQQRPLLGSCDIFLTNQGVLKIFPFPLFSANRSTEFFPSDIGSELITLIGLLDNNKSGSEENFSQDIKDLIQALRAGEDFDNILQTKIISENRGHFQYIKGSIYNTRKRAILNYRKSVMCQFLPDTLKKSINLTNSIYIDTFEEKKDGSLKERNSRKKQLSQDIGNISQISMNPNINPTFLSSCDNNSNSYLLFSNGGQVSSQLSEEQKQSQLKISESQPNKNILQLFSDKKVKVKKRKIVQGEDVSTIKDSNNNSLQSHSDQQVENQQNSCVELNKNSKEVLEKKELDNESKQQVTQNEKSSKVNENSNVKKIGIQIINQTQSQPKQVIIPLILEQQKLVKQDQDEGLKKKSSQELEKKSSQELEKIIEKPQNKSFSMKTEQQSPQITPSQRQNIEKQSKLQIIESTKQKDSPQNQDQEINQNFATFGANITDQNQQSNTPQNHTKRLNKYEEKSIFQNNTNQIHRLEGNLKVTTKKPSLNGSVIMIASQRTNSSSSSSSNTSSRSSQNSQQLIAGIIHPIPIKTNSAEGYLLHTLKDYHLNKRNSSPVKKSSESPKIEMPNNHYSPQTLSSSSSSSPHILHSPFSMRHLIPNKTESNQVISSRRSFQERLKSAETTPSLLKLCMLEIDQEKKISQNNIQQSVSPQKQPIFPVNIHPKRSSLMNVGTAEKEQETRRESQNKRGTSFSQRKSIFQDTNILQRKSLRSCGISDSRITKDEDSTIKQVKQKCPNAAVIYKNKNIQENSIITSSVAQKPMIIEQKQPQSMKQEIIQRNELQGDIINNKGVILSQIESKQQNTLVFGQKQISAGKNDNSMYQKQSFHLANSPYPNMVTPVKKPQELGYNHHPSIDGNTNNKDKSQNLFQDNNTSNNNNLISFLSDTRASSLIFCNGSHGKVSNIHFESSTSSPNQPQNSSPFQFSIREPSPEKNNSPLLYSNDPYSRSNQIPRRKFGQDLTSHFSDTGDYLGFSPISSLNQQKPAYQQLQLFQGQKPLQQIGQQQQSKLSSNHTSQQTQQQQQQQFIYPQKSQQHQPYQQQQQDQFQQKIQIQSKQTSNNLPSSQQYFFPQYQNNLTQQQYSQFANQDSVPRQKESPYSRQLSPINSSQQQQTNYLNRCSPYLKDPSFQTQSLLTSQPVQQQRFNTMQTPQNQQINSWHGDDLPQQSEKQTQKILNYNFAEESSHNYPNGISQQQKTPIFLSRGYSRSELPISRNTSIS